MFIYTENDTESHRDTRNINIYSAYRNKPGGGGFTRFTPGGGFRFSAHPPWGVVFWTFGVWTFPRSPQGVDFIFLRDFHGGGDYYGMRSIYV